MLASDELFLIKSTLMQEMTLSKEYDSLASFPFAGDLSTNDSTVGEGSGSFPQAADPPRSGLVSPVTLPHCDEALQAFSTYEDNHPKSGHLERLDGREPSESATFPAHLNPL